jgi:hypothetical protein
MTRLDHANHHNVNYERSPREGQLLKGLRVRNEEGAD